MKLKDKFVGRLSAKEDKGDEFGFTTRYTEGVQRIIRQDGSFNVKRIGEKKLVFHELLTMSWMKFSLFILFYYTAVNLIFATLYLLVDYNGIGMTSDYEVHNTFLVALFFSAQTLTTVGYGSLYPLSSTVSLMAASEALIGLMGFAIFTGLMYGRFANTPHSLKFSKKAVLGPYKDGLGIMFRAANERNHNLTELEVKVTLAMVLTTNGKTSRKFYPLPIDNNRITYFPLNWTMVHHINEDSPLYGMTAQDMADAEVELLIMIKGFNETSSQEMHARFSYTHREMVWNAKFKLPYYFDEQGATVFELNKIDEYEMLEPIPVAASTPA
jgi:inward rectifier potassium channel